MGGAFRAVGRAVGGIARGIGSAVGGVVRGVGHLFQGRPLKALGSVVGGVVKGTGHVLKGGLGAVKDVLGDPLLMGVAGFATFGIGGAIAGPLLGKLGSGVFGAAERGVSNLFGLNARPAQGQMQYQNNYGNYGRSNGIMAGGCVGGTYGGGYGMPGGGYGMPGGGYGMPGGGYGMPGRFPGGYGPAWPSYGCTPCCCRFH